MNSFRWKIAFRADGSHQLGLGHIVRCLALAEKLSGHDICFYTTYEPSVEKLLRETNTHSTKTVDAGIDDEAGWMAGRILREGFDLFIVDLLKYPPDYLQTIKQTGVRLVSFHEYETDDDASDVVINYNAFPDFNRLCRQGTLRHCWGPTFAVIREAVRKLGHVKTKDEVRKILITMGGSDPNGITLKALKALLPVSNVTLIIHIGPAFGHKSELEALAQEYQGRIVISESDKGLVDAMAEADIAVAAGGNTMYELCCLGIPSIIVAQNEHQLTFANELSRHSAVICLGRNGQVTEECIFRAVENLIHCGDKRRLLSDNGRRLIDGSGGDKLIKRINDLMTANNELVK